MDRLPWLPTQMKVSIYIGVSVLRLRKDQSCVIKSFAPGEEAVPGSNRYLTYTSFSYLHYRSTLLERSDVPLAVLYDFQDHRF